MSTRSTTAPDLAAIAREAVVGFLQEASAATAQRASAAPAMAAPAAPTAEPPASLPAEDTAWRAAALSVATLDRIEAAAAKVEEDIATALRVQAELQAGAGEAAERAVRAAMSAASSSRAAAQSEHRARIVLHRIERYLGITFILLIVAIIILLITATPVG